MSSHPATYYDLLRVSRRARPEGIRLAYRRLAQRLHPDKHAGRADAERAMAALNEAYAVLSDPARRARYDETIGSQRRTRGVCNRRLAELQQIDAAWPWWLLFATVTFCAVAVGAAVYKGYVPGAGRASLAASQSAAAFMAQPRAALSRH